MISRLYSTAIDPCLVRQVVNQKYDMHETWNWFVHTRLHDTPFCRWRTPQSATHNGLHGLETNKEVIVYESEKCALVECRLDIFCRHSIGI